MSKNPFEDIVPPKKRTIRDIENSHISRSEQESERETTREYDRIPHQGGVRKRKSKHLGLWFVAIIVIIGLILSFSFLFSGAIVTIVPKQSKTIVDAIFDAAINADEGEFTYEVMTLEKTDSTKVPATGKREVKEKASGVIVIYNNFSSSSQRLIKNTRFETPEGLIYRIDKSIEVPGQKTENGGKTPGSIEVTVFADEFGDKYNVGLTDFTIPGFKGDPRFDKFYARSKTPMTGGFEGEKLTASAEDVEKAKNGIRADLQKQLLSEAFSKKPDEFYLFDDIIFVEFESQPQIESGGEVEVVEKVVLHGILFNKKEFASNIAKNTLAIFDDEEVDIADISTLTITVENKEKSHPWEDEEFKFKVKGNVHIIWLFDEEKLKQDLAGKTKAALTTVLSGYPSIDQAEVVIRPFWKKTFPDKITKISLEKTIEI